jgi:hypothetical protein
MKEIAKKYISTICISLILVMLLNEQAIASEGSCSISNSNAITYYTMLLLMISSIIVINIKRFLSKHSINLVSLTKSLCINSSS